MRGSSPRMTERERRLKLTPEQIKLVQASFAKVAPISDQAAVMFYDRLFETAPQVKAMFPVDMTEQRKKLMATLAGVVDGLSKLQTILPDATAFAPPPVRSRPQPRPYPGGAATPF